LCMCKSPLISVHERKSDDRPVQGHSSSRITRSFPDRTINVSSKHDFN
jgi:hypothetical protein